MTRDHHIFISAIVASAFLAACKSETREYHVDPGAAKPATQAVTVTDLFAGGSNTTGPATVPAFTQPAPQNVKNPYEENAYAMSEGKRLFDAYNCSGCHAHGGGDKGPALMDDKWIYGSAPEQIHATIVQGRPNGMPSFRDRIPDQQVWQITAYVRSLSGLASTSAAPARDDHMQYKAPENSTPTTIPVNSGTPHDAEVPQ